MNLPESLRLTATKPAGVNSIAGTSGEADVVGIPGVHIECKRVEKLNIYTAMAQAVRDARPGEIPTVFHRKNWGGLACDYEIGGLLGWEKGSR